jgi:FAD/FMN-containing dehydrogenase
VSVEPFLEEVRASVGPDAVVVDAGIVAGHVVDWTGRWQGRSPAVLRPATPDAVQAIVVAARRHRIALVAQGGNTGLVGGSVPHAGEVVVSLRRLDALGPVDEASGQVTAGAGVTLEQLQRHAGRCGLAFAVDLGARASATVGGMVATNAGGLHVVRYGSMREQVLGLDAVLGTGAAVSVNPAGLVKDNTGYDLAGLLCGSEGTLGIVTAARLRLVRPPRNVATALVGASSLEAALDAAAVLGRLPSILALELVLGDGLALVADHLGTDPPFDVQPAAALLVEAAADHDVTEELAEAVTGLGDAVTGAAVAIDERDRLRLWRWREAHPEAAAALGVVHKADVSIPAPQMAAFLHEVVPAVHRVLAGAPVLRYGHLGDGNIHVNVVRPADVAPSVGDAAVDAVLDLVVAHGGSVSAEHGVGVAKRRWLERQRGRDVVEAMRALKAALDPDRICNPGVML